MSLKTVRFSLRIATVWSPCFFPSSSGPRTYSLTGLMAMKTFL
jgi:hypothetical protein